MSYHIEYLKEPSDEDSICHAFVSKSLSLSAAEADALKHADEARAKGAHGFQIRHVNAVDQVVAIADFRDFDIAPPEDTSPD